MSHPLATVRDITGKIIHLGMFESVHDIKVEDTRLVVAINTARYKETRASYTITNRGITLYTFLLDETTGCWSRTATVPVWWSTDERVDRFAASPVPERETSAIVTPHRTRKNGYRGDARR